MRQANTGKLAWQRRKMANYRGFCVAEADGSRGFGKVKVDRRVSH